MKGHALQSCLLQAQLNDFYQSSSQIPSRMENMDLVLAVEQIPLPEEGFAPKKGSALVEQF